VFTNLHQTQALSELSSAHPATL